MLKRQLRVGWGWTRAMSGEDASANTVTAICLGAQSTGTTHSAKLREGSGISRRRRSQGRPITDRRVMGPHSRHDDLHRNYR
jgi:hypothetical protein